MNYKKAWEQLKSTIANKEMLDQMILIENGMNNLKKEKPIVDFNIHNYLSINDNVESLANALSQFSVEELRILGKQNYFTGLTKKNKEYLVDFISKKMYQRKHQGDVFRISSNKDN